LQDRFGLQRTTLTDAHGFGLDTAGAPEATIVREVNRQRPWSNNVQLYTRKGSELCKKSVSGNLAIYPSSRFQDMRLPQGPICRLRRRASRPASRASKHKRPRGDACGYRRTP
jgi:hypothetical protein